MPRQKRLPAQPTRRDFTRCLALLAAAPLAVPTAPAQAAPETLADAAAALLEVARARYGKHLSEEQLQALASSVARGVASAERMKRIPLRNGDEPAIIFQADLP
jgi:hypothetical protein